MTLRLVPITFKAAKAFIAEHHRHNKPPTGGKFALGAVAEDTLVGVAVVGRPVARMLDDGFTAEVTRVCVIEGAPMNACSFLYGRAWRVWQQMGGLRMVTYTLQSEGGFSLRGAGWRVLGDVPGRSRPCWKGPDRDRAVQEVFAEPKRRWGVEVEKV